MSHLHLLFIFSILAACSSPAVSTDDKAAASTESALAADSECDLSTALIPGVPGSPGHLIRSGRNPNGDSELADLMRTFVDDLREVRGQMDAKTPVKKLFPRHRKMRCSWHTDPLSRNEDYDMRAQGYLAIVQAFDEAPSKSLYNAMIAGCVSCHTAVCPGPITFISQLKLAD